MRNIALKLMYNGTAYHGWQMQRTEASVQETLQRGLSMVCGERVRLTGVGRTDAGVHAERYVANFRTSSRIPIDRLPFAVNTHTPEDIVVREALEESIESILTTKSSIDILRKVQEYKQQNKTYRWRCVSRSYG